MELFLDQNIGAGYKNKSQIIRNLTEKWVGDYGFCPRCAGILEHCPNNSPVADFYCKHCGKIFELKAKNGKIGAKINDGAYATMISRITSNTNPDFFFLNYDSEMRVKNFFAVPNFFFTPRIIEQRKPLAPTAKRAGWVGCNILLNQIPESGKLFYIQDYKVESQERILKKYQNIVFIETQKSKGWIFEIMHCIERLKKNVFLLSDLYVYEKELQKKYPQNNNIQAKIRQQVQFLRDKGYLDFIGNGVYCLR
ncbi:MULTISPECIES: DpnI domain-containing protein [unclassified Helicobacter]|uniref:DpnI domain-containing protein n=1 Tax=unclassified Helicobacter TaxID=2593540 RepID=UPI000CF0A071|nr:MULTISPECIES: DpnI domain-containing protein [unclassified Helicobacter]